MEFYCIADEYTVRGFRLAGIGSEIAETPEQARDAIDAAVARPDCGIIIITEKVAAWVRPQVDTIRLERERPLIVEIPGPGRPLPGRRSLRELIEEAVGVSVG